MTPDQWFVASMFAVAGGIFMALSFDEDVPPRRRFWLWWVGLAHALPLLVGLWLVVLL